MSLKLCVEMFVDAFCIVDCNCAQMINLNQGYQSTKFLFNFISRQFSCKVILTRNWPEGQTTG